MSQKDRFLENFEEFSANKATPGIKEDIFLKIRKIIPNMNGF